MDLAPEIATEILKSSNEAIVVVDAEGLIVFVNCQAEALFGYSAQEMLGQVVELLMPEAIRNEHTAQRQKYRSAPHTRPLVAGLNLKGKRKSGETFEAEISLTPIPTAERMLVSSVIREIGVGDASEAYFRHLLESAPDAMIIVDHDGRVAIANDQAVIMFGYSRMDLIGQPVEMLLPETVRESHVGHRKDYGNSPRVRPMGPGMNLTGRRADGTIFPVEISLSPVRSDAGRFVSSVIRDVTERKQMEAELIAARQAAERANKANTAFLAAASHDLRQPVQALSLLNGALRRTVQTPLARELVESQQHSLDAMTNLLNSLLDISRLDAGAVVPEVEDFAVQRLIDRLAAEFARQAQQKGLTFQARDCGAIIRSDPQLLGEIIQNFVSNAIRYTDAGTVKLECSAKNGELCIDVRDTGIGIEPQYVEEIFREFHQLKVPGSNKEGFGLGLAIVRRLADLLDHEILVDSTPGKGSCFSVCTPLIKATGQESMDVAGPEVRDNASEQSGLIILIEDDVKVANAWGLLLESEGYRVASAASASDARAIVEHLENAPDLLISDFHLLDGSTGVQAVQEIRAAFGKNIPAFIVSGDTSKVVQDARTLENSLLMSKPVNVDLLLNRARLAIATGNVPQD